MLSNVSPWQMSGGTQVLLGDYQRNSDVQYQEQIAPIQLPSEVDYDVIRRGLWESSDMMYKYALGMMAQKMNTCNRTHFPRKRRRWQICNRSRRLPVYKSVRRPTRLIRVFWNGL